MALIFAAMAAAADAGVGLGIGLLLLSLVCLGTWPAALRLCTYAPGVRVGVEGDNGCFRRLRRVAGRYAQSRHPCHAYLDYAIAYVAFSSTVPILLSHLIPNEEESEYGADISGLQQVPLILSAIVGGSLLSLGNMSTQWATTVYASPLTTVLALQASLTVVLGTSINYKLEPSKTARPNLLAWGVVLFLVAIGLSVMAHHLYSNDRGHRKRDVVQSDEDEANVEISMRNFTPALSQGQGASDRTKAPVRHDDYRACRSDVDADSFTDDVTEQSHAPLRSASTAGLAIAFGGGLCFGFFSPAFNIAVNNPFGWGANGEMTASGGLSVASANLWFSLAFTLTSILWNVCLMRNPPRDVEPSTFQQYLSERLMQDRAVAILAGLICAGGNVLQFQGGHLAGFATSDLVQAFPLVGTFWDVVIFREFSGAHRTIVVCLCCMYLVYVSGIILLASSV